MQVDRQGMNGTPIDFHHLPPSFDCRLNMDTTIRTTMIAINARLPAKMVAAHCVATVSFKGSFSESPFTSNMPFPMPFVKDLASNCPFEPGNPAAMHKIGTANIVNETAMTVSADNNAR
jgi:hypothetical protein